MRGRRESAVMSIVVMSTPVLFICLVIVVVVVRVRRGTRGCCHLYLPLRYSAAEAASCFEEV